LFYNNIEFNYYLLITVILNFYLKGLHSLLISTHEVKGVIENKREGLSSSEKKLRLKEGVNESDFFTALEQAIDVDPPSHCPVYRCRTKVSDGLYKINRVNLL
jgi:hypothetical protein